MRVLSGVWAPNLDLNIRSPGAHGDIASLLMYLVDERNKT